MLSFYPYNAIISLNISEFTRKFRTNSLDKSSCYRKVLDTYPSLVDATSSCKNDSKCTGIVDVDCEEKLFSTCSGEMKFGSSWEMVCFWRKGKIWLPFSISKDLEIFSYRLSNNFNTKYY